MICIEIQQLQSPVARFHESPVVALVGIQVVTIIPSIPMNVVFHVITRLHLIIILVVATSAAITSVCPLTFIVAGSTIVPMGAFPIIVGSAG